jgi:hypothetical protein
MGACLYMLVCMSVCCTRMYLRTHVYMLPHIHTACVRIHIHTYIHRLNTTLEELSQATERADTNERLREEARAKLCSELSMAADEIERLQGEVKARENRVPASDVDALKDELKRANEQVRVYICSMQVICVIA